MKTALTRLTLAAFTAAALAAATPDALAQTTNLAPAEKKGATQTDNEAKPQKAAKAGPFHGKLIAVDKVAKTIVVGKRTFQITSETRIKKAGKPALLEDGVIGETVGGYVKPAADGKLVVTTLNFGPKPAPNEKPKRGSETNAPPKQVSQPQ